MREIYKYQPADSILREIIQFFGGKEQKQEDVELIGVYSPVYEPLRSAFALSLTQVMAESGRTLYCNLEAFSGLEEVLAAQDRENLSLCKNFAYMTVGLGMAVMAVMGVVMYVFAPDEIVIVYSLANP